MKIAVSNIAWTNEEEPEVATLLRRLGVENIEVAPTKKWSDPTKALETEIDAYKDFWQSHGLEIVAFQSMLFNRPDLKLFEGEVLRNETCDYLERFTDLAGLLGAGIMVFGSPKNRQRGDMPIEQATPLAKDFFSEIGKYAKQNGTVFCIEPNPEAYACDFVTTAQQGIDFVKVVNTDGFGLHLDVAGMTLAGDSVVQAIYGAGDMIRHFHISAPQLDQVEDRLDVDYRGAADALRAINYRGYVSIEMRPGEIGKNVKRVEKAVRFAQSVFND